MEGGFAFFTPREARTIAAAAARLIPTDDVGPGATEAGAVHYIDRMLAGQDPALQDTYRRGVARLDRDAHSRGEESFADAPAEVQDLILHAIEEAESARRSSAFGYLFFEALLAHTREGVFADPTHGGNRGLVGWRLLGYHGVHLVHTEDDFAPNALIQRPTTPTLSDFQRSRPVGPS